MVPRWIANEVGPPHAWARARPNRTAAWAVAAFLLAGAAPLGAAPRVTLRSTPDGAFVRVNGRFVGVTPWTGLVAPGAVELSFVAAPCAPVTVLRDVPDDDAAPPPEIHVHLACPEAAPPTEPAPVPPVLAPVAASVGPPDTGPAVVARAAAPPPGPRTLAVRGTASVAEGVVVADGAVFRTNVELAAAAFVAWRAVSWLPVGLELATSLERPVGLTVRPGVRFALPYVFVRLAAELVVVPAFQVGVGFGLGSELPLGQTGLAALVGIDGTVWPADAALVDVRGRVGLSWMF